MREEVLDLLDPVYGILEEPTNTSLTCPLQKQSVSESSTYNAIACSSYLFWHLVLYQPNLLLLVQHWVSSEITLNHRKTGLSLHLSEPRKLPRIEGKPYWPWTLNKLPEMLYAANIACTVFPQTLGSLGMSSADVNNEVGCLGRCVQSRRAGDENQWMILDWPKWKNCFNSACHQSLDGRDAWVLQAGMSSGVCSLPVAHM